MVVGGLWFFIGFYGNFEVFLACQASVGFFKKLSTKFPICSISKQIDKLPANITMQHLVKKSKGTQAHKIIHAPSKRKKNCKKLRIYFKHQTNANDF